MMGIGEKIWAWFVTNALLLVAIWAGLMTAGFAVQTVRIDGFQIDPPFVKPIGPRGLKTELAEANKLIEEFKATQKRARADAIAARNSEALALIELKETTDEAREQIERTNLERARAFAAAGGVRPRSGGGAAGASPAPASGGGAQGGDGAGAVSDLDDLRDEALVTVTARDVEICTINTSRLLAAQPWGIDLEARNREPVEP